MKSITKWLQSAILRPIPELDNASFQGSPWENGNNQVVQRQAAQRTA